jgi:hypothetical protein
MPVLSLVVPAILDGCAGAKIAFSVVKAVSVLVVNHGVPIELHAAEICHNEMQRDSAALDIPILVHLPPRPGKLIPYIHIHEEFVV